MLCDVVRADVGLCIAGMPSRWATKQNPGRLRRPGFCFNLGERRFDQ
jgi:hypothetical protein